LAHRRQGGRSYWTEFPHNPPPIDAQSSSQDDQQLRGLCILPSTVYASNLPFFIAKMRTRWIGKHIPRQDAKCVGSLLAQLSEEQIEDAFRAGGYSQQEALQYTTAVKARIAQLEEL
jgi:hypothetical protein